MASKKMPDALKLVTIPEEEREEVKRIVLFEIDGVEYSVENKARPNLSFGYLRRVRTEGEAAAEAWITDKMLGDDALEALENYEDLTPEESERIKSRLSAIAQGGAERPKA